MRILLCAAVLFFASALTSGEDGVSLIKDIRDNSDPAVRAEAIKKLEQSKDTSEAAAEALAKAYSDFGIFAKKISSMPVEPPPEVLNQIDAYGRMYHAAAKALESMGPRAKSALPMLKRDLEENHAMVAANVIVKIDPELLSYANFWLALIECERFLNIQHGNVKWGGAPEYAHSLKKLLPEEPIVAAEGLPGEAKTERGYCFRFLSAKGANTVGGRESFIKSGKWTEGFAVLAYPAKHGNEGTYTLIAAFFKNEVYFFRKDLGTATEEYARTTTEFNPDETWEKVRTTLKYKDGDLMWGN